MRLRSTAIICIRCFGFKALGQNRPSSVWYLADIQEYLAVESVFSSLLLSSFWLTRQALLILSHPVIIRYKPLYEDHEHM